MPDKSPKRMANKTVNYVRKPAKPHQSDIGGTKLTFESKSQANQTIQNKELKNKSMSAFLDKSKIKTIKANASSATVNKTLKRISPKNIVQFESNKTTSGKPTLKKVVVSKTTNSTKPLGNTVVKNDTMLAPQSKTNNVPRPATNSDRKVVILTSTNAAFLDFTDNWLASIRRIGPHPNITIVAEDNATYEHLMKVPDVHVIRPDQSSSASDKLVFNTPEYKKFVNKRAQYILDILKEGYDVLFSDVDTFWAADPFPYFEEDFDIFAQLDLGPPHPRMLCAGFVYYKSTRLSIKFVKLWIKKMNSYNNTRPDQGVLNKLIKKRSVPLLKVKVLDPDKFLSGHFYFDEEWRTKNPQVKPVMLHNNWIIGHDVKVQRFKNLGMWLLDQAGPRRPKQSARRTKDAEQNT
ncbi:uncharacterized protein [Amphiura filiformis]|uniref:uncharacterized protein n=1 Tax=Amphiura filiformis TaxID=82378 RepID=UPI003B21E70A